MHQLKKGQLAWLLAGIFALSLTGCQLFAPDYVFKGILLDPPLPVADFELMSSRGIPFRLSDAEAEITLIFFGYTFCPDVCPLTLADVRTALAGLEAQQRNRVQVIFVSVDPDRDTPEALAKYVAAFDPTFIGLTGDVVQLEPILQSFGAYAEKEEGAEAKKHYLMNHTARLYLLNQKQEIPLTYAFNFEPEDLRSDLDYLLQ